MRKLTFVLFMLAVFSVFLKGQKNKIEETMLELFNSSKYEECIGLFNIVNDTSQQFNPNLFAIRGMAFHSLKNYSKAKKGFDTLLSQSACYFEQIWFYDIWQIRFSNAYLLHDIDERNSEMAKYYGFYLNNRFWNLINEFYEIDANNITLQNNDYRLDAEQLTSFREKSENIQKQSELLIKLNPNYYLPYFFLAEIHRISGNKKTAFNFYRKASKLFSHSENDYLPLINEGKRCFPSYTFNDLIQNSEIRKTRFDNFKLAHQYIAYEGFKINIEKFIWIELYKLCRNKSYKKKRLDEDYISWLGIEPTKKTTEKELILTDDFFEKLQREWPLYDPSPEDYLWQQEEKRKMQLKKEKQYQIKNIEQQLLYHTWIKEKYSGK